MTRFVTLLVAMAFPLASIAGEKPEPTQDNGKHEQAERGGSKGSGKKSGGSKGSGGGSKGSGGGSGQGSGQRPAPAPSSPQRSPGNGGSNGGGSTSPSSPDRSPSNGGGSNGDRDGGSGSSNDRSDGGSTSPGTPQRSPGDNSGSTSGSNGNSTRPSSPDRSPGDSNGATQRPGSPERGPGAASGHTASPASPDRARPGAASMQNAQPVSRSVKVGSAAPAPAPGTRVAASAHVPANFRTTSSAAAKSSNAVAAHRYNAAHRAASARHVAHVAAVHRHNAVVAHHRSAVVAHHRAWARHHPYVWRPARAHAYVHPRWYWRPWHHGSHVYWYHGVFVYGPRPVHHHHYAVAESGGASVPPEAESPRRQIDRTQSWAVGLRGGSYLSGYDNGAGYGDAGIGVALRYRPVEALGLELQWQHHDETFAENSSRGQSPLSASVELFGTPWSRVNPYVLAGVTFNNRDIQDQIGPLTTVETSQTIWGPHGGLGIEFNVAERASVNFDIRGIGYLNVPAEDPSTPGALQANMGVNFYF